MYLKLFFLHFLFHEGKLSKDREFQIKKSRKIPLSSQRTSKNKKGNFVGSNFIAKFFLILKLMTATAYKNYKL